MHRFKDIPREYREESSYLGTLPKELRQLTMRYKESCRYTIRELQPSQTDPNMRGILITDRVSLNCIIPIERGIRNKITMKKFISNVKRGIYSAYRVTSTYSIESDAELIISILNTQDPSSSYIIRFELCRELEEALLNMESFQNSEEFLEERPEFPQI